MRAASTAPFTRSRSGAFAAAPHTPADTLFGDRLGAFDAARAPWQARLREFARRGEFADGSQHIALLDPTGLWATAVVKMLGAASASPLRRLGGDAGQTAVIGLAMARRDGSTMHVCHAATPPPGAHPGEAALVLAAQADLGVVVVGPLPPAEVDTLLTACLHAARQTGWQCPRLLFLLPPGAAWIAHKIDALRWPERVRVAHDDTALNGAAAVWNRVLAAWESERQAPGTAPAAAGAGPGAGAVGAFSAAGTLQRARECLLEMLQVEGLLGCAVVDAASGIILARESRQDHPVDLDRAALSSAQALRAHRESSRAMGFADGQVDELTLRAGHRVLLVRMSPAHAELFLLVLLEGALSAGA